MPQPQAGPTVGPFRRLTNLENRPDSTVCLVLMREDVNATPIHGVRLLQKGIPRKYRQCRLRLWRRGDTRSSQSIGGSESAFRVCTSQPVAIFAAVMRLVRLTYHKTGGTTVEEDQQTETSYQDDRLIRRV